MSVTLDLNTSSRFNIVNLYQGRSWPTIEMPYTEDDEVTPIAYPSGDYFMEIFSDFQKTKRVMLLTEADGLVVAGNLITITRDKTENNLRPGIYYFRIYCDISAEYSTQLFHGELRMNP